MTKEETTKLIDPFHDEVAALIEKFRDFGYSAEDEDWGFVDASLAELILKLKKDDIVIEEDYKEWFPSIRVSRLSVSKHKVHPNIYREQDAMSKLQPPPSVYYNMNAIQFLTGDGKVYHGRVQHENNDDVPRLMYITSLPFKVKTFHIAVNLAVGKGYATIKDSEGYSEACRYYGGFL